MLNLTEMKRRKCKSLIPQLYAEAINMATRCVMERIKSAREDVNVVEVYCLLLQDHCTEGLLSKLTLNLKECACTIEEDKNMKPINKCFEVILNNL